MLFDYEVLKLAWWVLVGVLLIGFAITDGMDMGVGNVLPFLGHTDSERRVIIESVSPHWEGNQVWFITAGGAIFAAWPAVYAAAFSGFYLAMLLVLFALFLRPVGFDYRDKLQNPTWRNAWDWGLFVGGFVPSLIFGVAFGNLLQGVPFHLDEFLRVTYDAQFIWALIPLLNPFALLAGLVSVAMLTAHGSTWLQLRADPVIAERAKTTSFYLGIVTAALFALGGLWIWLGNMEYFVIVSQPPFDAMPNPLNKIVAKQPGALFNIYSEYPLAMLAPLLGIAGPLLMAALSRAGRSGFAFVFSALGMTGIITTAGLSMFPFIMPSTTDPVSSLTVWDATSSHLTLTVMFWTAAIFVPIVLLYTIWCYVRMWGRITTEEMNAPGTSGY
ncbi:cytochrome d ubiquinol oxidase subunit II [Cohaesibacter sp. ES.047]|uniref:cytochrome d ubiquinol oxidase subunit II n=1 Tax=Cohaesibacter sp. ES.047 TaxID=1798205 RepID=UPI000BB6AE24|nr:cytochrome d ubiquinol oxidase subunit II [Cohaesibacter sp. ES.047]SNY92702.1 cytochrome d ubiquinol oxidase subunit II [Cohaesibacter sp. ES.047]